MSQVDCIFCKIAAKQMSSTIVFEDEVVFAFLDIGPVSDGHTLVIPKEHIDRFDRCPPQLLSNVCSRLGKIAAAIQKGIGSDGYNILCNNGRAAGQVVDHLHFHIIPRRTGDNFLDRWPSYKYSAGRAEKIAQNIRNQL